MRASMRLTAGCVTYSSSAALLKLPQRAAASNAKSAFALGSFLRRLCMT